MMRGLIFDLDGVLINSMPLHIEAWRNAFNEIVNIEVNERMICALEGMRGIDLATRLLELNNLDKKLAQLVTKRKSEIFRSHFIKAAKPFVGVQQLLEKLRCVKAVVSGSSKEDVSDLLSQFKNIEFEVIITADDVSVGKPDPLAFVIALRAMNIDKKHAMIIENAPLGIEAANTAGINSVVVLNNSPLNQRDFNGKIDRSRIHTNIDSISTILFEWCR